MNYSFVNINVIKYNEKFLFSSQTLAEKKKKGGIALPCTLKCIIIISLCIKKKYISYAFEKINK